MPHVLLRRKGFGLSTLRELLQRMNRNDVIIRNHQSIRTAHASPDAVAVSWGYVNTCPIQFAQVNKPNAVGFVSNKGLFRKKLYEQLLTMQTTTHTAKARDLLSNGVVLVVRPKKHLGGRHTYLVRNDDELYSAIRACGEEWYASEYIPKDHEYRVFVSQGRIAWVAEKLVDDPTQVAWNNEQGGIFNNVRFGAWRKDVINAALKAMTLSGLDFGAVDIITKGDKVYVLEINTAISMDSEYRLDTSAKVFNHILNTFNTVQKYNVNIEAYMARGNWRHVIHPAVSSEAIIGEGTIYDEVRQQSIPREPIRPHYSKSHTSDGRTLVKGHEVDLDMLRLTLKSDGQVNTQGYIPYDLLVKLVEFARDDERTRLYFDEV